MRYRDDGLIYIRQNAESAGSGTNIQAGRDQFVFDSGTVHVHFNGLQSPSAPPVSLRPPVNLRPPQLHGRESAFRDLGGGDLAALMGCITVLSGLGGIGKSALALTIANYARSAGATVLWVHASGGSEVSEAFRQIATKLCPQGSEGGETLLDRLNTADLAWEALHASEKPWLLVFDNADDPARLHQDLGPNWLEPSASGAVLVTTRQAHLDVWPPGTRLKRLGPLDHEAGADMLLALSGSSAPDPAERGAARELAERLGGVPLALRAAGLCVAQPFSPIQDLKAFGQALDRDFPNVVDRAATTSPHSSTIEDARSLVMQTWEVSLDALEQQGLPQVRPIMRTLSCWASRPVPVALLSPKVLARTHRLEAGRWDSVAVERALNALSAVGLIDVADENSDGPSAEADAFYHRRSDMSWRRCVIVHPLVAEVNAAHLERSPHRARTWAAAVRCLGALRDTEDQEATAQWPFAVPHMMAVAGRLPPSLEELFETVVNTHMYLSRYLRMVGRYDIAHKCAMALRARLATFTPNDRIRYLVELNAAEWAWNMSRLDEADTMSAAACRLAVSSLGPDSIEFYVARALAVAIHSELGSLESGAKMARELCADMDDKPHLPYLGMQAHHHFATILRQSGRLDEAENHSRRAVESSDCLEPGPFTQAIIRHELGVILWHRGHLDRALTVLSEVLRQQRSFLPAWHPSVLVTRYDIASIHSLQGNSIRAFTDFMDIWLAEQDLLGKDHYKTLQTRHQVGQILVEIGEIDQAEPLLSEVEAEYETQGLQGRLTDLLSTRHERVHIAAQRGQHVEAHQGWRRILNEEQRNLGARHPSTLRTHYNWAFCWAVLGSPSVARAEMRKVLVARRDVLGINHYETKQAADMLTALARQQSKKWRFGGNRRRNVPVNRAARRNANSQASDI
ncbi:tetratricopeptide repeat protein [Streptomyces sp. NBC_01429]|uniref:tetratricopeptide repeat protein n=1 Tax=Streptomyces sp. NBC_01429 TaxID=2903862 RepID=UPI002E2837B2|nr:tetratricopeptide repeat protein [Streptomyces sp. NBC_01429]